MARLEMGRERLEWAALSVNETVEVEVRPHSVMGVVIPRVVAYGEPPETPYGLGNTPVALDEASSQFRVLLTEIPALSETMTTVWRLAQELQKTQRRVNALQYIFIPQYEETIAYIESALEEREREETFRLKRIKSQVSGATIGPAQREYEQVSRDIGGRGAPLAPIYRDLRVG
jgi:V/A-type H+-transporting ATPase subunit D